MDVVRGERDNQQIKLLLSGRIDSTNAGEVDAEVKSIADGGAALPVLIDAAGLEYISSAGLRVLLRLRKTNEKIHIINVNPEIYEIFDMTGFTQMMTIDRAYRTVSIEGCEVIGRGANGTIYRIDHDNVVKVYNNADALEEIQHEREVARLALILGIPTAISYDVVRVGDSYGSVFELLDAKSFSKIIATEPERLDWCVEEYVDMLKKIHGTLVPEGDLPDMKGTALGWVHFMKDYLPAEAWQKLWDMVDEIPHDDHMLHGDYHTKNLELVNDEVILIDMDTLAVGHPVFELASMFNAFIGYSEYDHNTVKEFQGFDFETATDFWNKVLRSYLGTDDENAVRQIEDKARIIGYTRMIRRSIRRKGLETEDGRAEIDLWTGELLELLDRTDSLFFASSEILVDAEVGNLQKVIGFVESKLDEYDCPVKTAMQICVAVEEIFTNIAKYAYPGEEGVALIRVEAADGGKAVKITFTDRGHPYDPLTVKDPDVTLSAEDRAIGGLGLFMVKKTMDSIEYEYKDGKNILTITKEL
ncbi:MAG: ATP-binding protein [Bacillota bacterium]